MFVLSLLGIQMKFKNIMSLIIYNKNVVEYDYHVLQIVIYVPTTLYLDINE